VKLSRHFKGHGDATARQGEYQDAGAIPIMQQPLGELLAGVGAVEKSGVHEKGGSSYSPSATLRLNRCAAAAEIKEIIGGYGVAMFAGRGDRMN
jgi:hypothetical protein